MLADLLKERHPDPHCDEDNRDADALLAKGAECPEELEHCLKREALYSHDLEQIAGSEFTRLPRALPFAMGAGVRAKCIDAPEVVKVGEERAKTKAVLSEISRRLSGWKVSLGVTSLVVAAMVSPFASFAPSPQPVGNLSMHDLIEPALPSFRSRRPPLSRSARSPPAPPGVAQQVLTDVRSSPPPPGATLYAATRVRVAGDGACLFGATGLGDEHVVRELAVDWLEAHPDHPFQGGTIATYVEGETGLELPAYCARMRGATQWGGLPELEAVAQVVHGLVRVFEEVAPCCFTHVAVLGDGSER